jgi:protein-S-isoprenylcysteine O-methyltransferase Ste14
MLARTVVHTLVITVVLALLLFLPAGTLAWPQGWIFIALFAGCSEVTAVWLFKTDPDLLAARMKSSMSGEQKSSDRAVMAAIFFVMIVWIVFMPLDAQRLRWSHTPMWAQALGAMLILVAFIGWATVLKANSFASTQILVQKERGQKVISTGPYAIVRHPMYAYVLPLMIGAPLLLGSLWGLLGIALVFPLLGARALGEEAMLIAGLPGYREYAERVRYRLFPGLW